MVMMMKGVKLKHIMESNKMETPKRKRRTREYKRNGNSARKEEMKR